MAEGRRSSRVWIDDPALPRVIRLLRQGAGWSQRELGAAAGLTPSAVTRLESGDRRPSVDVFERLAEAFGLSPSYLVELAARLADSDDEGAATQVTEIVRSFTSSSGLASRYRPVAIPQETAPAYESSGLAPLERPEVAATIPDGELRWVFRWSVGRDERGYWIDPAARANRGGLDAEDVRIERFDDGTFVIDLSGLQHDIGPRDPDRHITLARLAGVDEPSLYDAYASTVLEIALPDGQLIVVEPTPDGAVHGEFPEGMAGVYVITAYNPSSRLTSPDENERRNRGLEGDLASLGAEFTAAVGRSPDGSWREDGFAVFDGDQGTLVELGRQYEQNALFRWTPTGRAVVYSDGRQESVHGWRARRFESGETHE